MPVELASPQPQLPIESPSYHVWTLGDGAPWISFHRRGADYVLRFPGLADFDVTADGSGIRCRPVPGAADHVLEHLCLNQVLPLAWSRQGKLMFHASAVETPAGALVFMGQSGRGKSTLAASFVQAGFRFLADDGLHVARAVDGYRIHPGHPSIRLWEDSRSAVGVGPDKLAPPLPYTAKARILAEEGRHFCGEPRPLRCAYLLGDGTAAKLVFERLTPQEALIELVRHSFLLDIEARDQVAAQFDRLADLACRSAFYRLDYPRRFDRLAAVRDAILAHCEFFRTADVLVRSSVQPAS